MTEPPAVWRARIELTAREPGWSDWIEQALLPEAAREVPRARSRVHRSGADRIEIAIEARDAGAVRAALNTYLGWIDLSAATLRAAAPGPGSRR